MNNALITFAKPENEPVKAYRPGSPERIELQKELERQSNEIVEIPAIINGQEVRTGDMGEVVMPHDHKYVIARYHKVGEKEVRMAIDAAQAAKQMKKTLFFALALAAICLMPSCKKYASEIAFGDTAGMRVATYDKTNMQSDHYESYYEIDLNNDEQCDIKLYSQLIASVAIGDPIVSYIKCKNKDIALLGDIILQEHYVHSDTTVTVQEGVTFQRITKTHTCERVDDTDIVEDSKEKLSLTAANAGESFGLEDSFLSTEVALNGFSYGFCDDPVDLGTDFVTQECDNYNNDCDYFPMNKEQYIGFKFTIDGRDHLGWMKIILEENMGEYYVRPIESAIQK